VSKRCAATWSIGGSSPRAPPTSALNCCSRVPGEDTLAVPLAGADGLLGTLVAERGRPFHVADAHLLEVIAHQLSAGLQRAELLTRVADEHLVADVLAALAEGRTTDAEAEARAAGLDLDRPYVMTILEPLEAVGDRGWAETAARAELRLRQVLPGLLADLGEERMRLLVPAAGASDLERLDAELARVSVEQRLAAGRSELHRGAAAGARGQSEAASAITVARAVAPAGGSRAYASLGVYRYLAQVPADWTPDERHARAIAALAAYDAKRRTELLATLERHLGDRGALAATARALYIHTNTLRQRLDRIERLTGLALADEDLLSLELALKLSRLRRTPAAA
jgi:DNA-binding PucR family transcriptional regulator